MRIHILLLITAVALATPIGARAQSLADVAASEAARRKAQTAPSKVYTNDTLAGFDANTIADVQAAADTAASKDANKSATDATASGATDKTQPKDEKKTEAYWKTRATTLQQNLARNKVLIEAMQSRINALHAEALGADLPGRQATLQSNLATATGEMERLKQENEKQEKELAGLHEEARRANIPPGWLR